MPLCRSVFSHNHSKYLLSLLCGCRSLVWGLMFMLGMALVSGFASVPGVRYSAVPQEVWPPCPLPLL